MLLGLLLLPAHVWLPVCLLLARPCAALYQLRAEGLAEEAQAKEAEVGGRVGDPHAAAASASALHGSLLGHKLSSAFPGGLREVTLEVLPGQCTVILGENGAGKSTLLAYLSRALPPLAGALFMRGHSAGTLAGFWELPPRQFGACAQEDCLQQGLSALENVAQFAAVRAGGSGRGGAATSPADLLAIAARTLEGLGLCPPLSLLPVKALSGGQQRRVSLACAIVAAPTLCLLDEPTTGMDPDARRKCWAALQGLKDRCIMALCTHSLEEANVLGDRVAILSRGRLCAQGSASALASSHGAGFTLTVSPTKGRGEVVTAILLARLPGARVLKGSGVLAEPAASGAGAGSSAGGVSSVSGSDALRSLQGSALGQLLSWGASQASGDAVAPSPPPISREDVATLTLAIPRALLRALPQFLRLLERLSTPASGLLRDWSLSPSGLEEVFLRVSELGREVPLEALAGSSSSELPQAASPAPRVHLCALCLTASAVPSMLHTAKGVAVCVPALVCAACATLRDGAAVEAARGGPIEAALVDAGQEAQGSAAEAPEAGAGSSSGEALAPACTGAPNSPAEAAGGGAPPPPLSALALLLRHAGAIPFDAGASRQTLISFCILLYVWIPLLLASRDRRPSSDGLPCRAGFFDPLGTRARGGSGTRDYNSTLCNRDTFISYVAGAAARGARGAVPTLYAPTAMPLYTTLQVCSDTGLPAPCNTSSSNASYLPTPDLATFAAPLWSFTSQPPGTAYASPRATLAYTDAQARARSPPALPFSALDLLGLPPQAAALQQFTAFDAGAPAGSSGWGAQDAQALSAAFLALQAQGALSAVRLQGVAQCSGWRLGARLLDHPASERWGWRVADPLNFSSTRLPTAALALRDLSPQGAAYDLLVYAARASQPSRAATRRPSTYPWVSAFAPPAAASAAGDCAAFTVRLPQDDAGVPEEGGNMGASAFGAHVALSMLHGAFLRALLPPPLPPAQAPHLAATLVGMPPIDWGSDGGALGRLWGSRDIVLPLIFSALVTLAVLFMGLTLGAALIVEEKFSRKVYLLLSQGASRAAYFLAFVRFQATFTGPLLALCLVMGAVNCLLSPACPPAALAYALGMNLALFSSALATVVGWAILLGSCARSPAAASTASVLLIALAFAGTVLCAMFAAEASQGGGAPTLALLAQPLLAHVWHTFLVFMEQQAGVDTAPLRALPLALSLLQGLAAGLLGAYLHAIVPGPPSTPPPPHPLFPLAALGAALRHLGCAAAASPLCSRFAALQEEEGGEEEEAAGDAASGEQKAPPADSLNFLPQAVDESVAREAQQASAALCALQRGDTPLASAPAIACEGLFISYQPPPDFSGAALQQWLAARCCAPRAAAASAPPLPPAAAFSLSSFPLLLPRGQILILLGPNGAGKTTFLNALTGIARSKKGRLRVLGRPPRSSGGCAVGVCPQYDVVWGEMSVRQHLELTWALKGLPPPLEPELRAAAGRVGLDGDSLLQPCRALSGGQRRRLTLGMALVGSPALLICDEPSTGLDDATRREVWALLLAERARGTALLVTSHSLEEAEALGDRIAVLARGRLRAIGSAGELKRRFAGGHRLQLLLAAQEDLAAARAAALHFVGSCAGWGQGAAAVQEAGAGAPGAGSAELRLVLQGGSAEEAVVDLARGAADPSASGFSAWRLSRGCLEEAYQRIVDAV